MHLLTGPARTRLSNLLLNQLVVQLLMAISLKGSWFPKAQAVTQDYLLIIWQDRSSC